MGWLLAAVFCSATPGSALAGAAERAQLQARQAALVAGFDAEEQACRQRFVVNACVQDVQQRRREALAPVRERLLQLDEADRAARAAARRDELAQKVRQRDERLAAAAAAASAAAQASAPRARQRMLPAAPLRGASASGDGQAQPRPQPAQQAASQAQQRAQENIKEARQREAEAEVRKARVARRLAERQAQGKPLQPLLPAPAPAGSAPR